MKRLFGLVCIAIFTMALLTACGDTTPTSNITSANETTQGSGAQPPLTEPTPEPEPEPTPTPSQPTAQTLSPGILISNQPGLEILEFGYSLVGTRNLFLRYSIILRNYNDQLARFPSFRITAFSSDGSILGTTRSVRGDLNPGETMVWSSQAFSVEERPDRVEVDVEPMEARNWSTNFQQHQPLVIQNVNENARGNILGQIVNPNDHGYSLVWAVVIYRDAEGMLLGGQSTSVSNVPANGTVAFDISGLSDDRAASFEVFTWIEGHIIS